MTEDFTDAVGRGWHSECAGRALADGFRTPLTPEDAAGLISFEVSADKEMSVWRAPHSFHLREIVFYDDVEVSCIFLGNLLMVYTVQVPIRTIDLPEQKIIVDHDFQQALDLQITATPHNFRYRLVGERRSERARPRRQKRPFILAVAPLCAKEQIGPGERISIEFRMPGVFRGERVVCSDWQDWEVFDVRLGGDPGHSVWDKPLKLVARSTDVPVYAAQISETITYEMRNLSDRPRQFDGRVYGALIYIY